MAVKTGTICNPNSPLKLCNIPSPRRIAKPAPKKPEQPKKNIPPLPARKPLLPLKRTDRRVFLNTMPLQTNPSLFLDRMMYVLGKDKMNLNGTNIYGYLYNCLKGTTGLVFPYTPQISFGHSATYEETNIIHSNITVQHYKNTPSPSISIDAVFTADNKNMAKHMLSAIWFLRAATKCDFGEASISTTDSNRDSAGMPPPILYLNGWNNLIDNVPVVITNFSYTLPQDKDYVSLKLNLDSQTFDYASDADPVEDYGVQNFMNKYEPLLKSTYKNGISFVQGEPIYDESISAENALSSKNASSNRKNAFFLQEWLPTELKIHIDLKIQYNLLKYKKCFDLNKYKMGILFLDNQKGGQTLHTVDSKRGTCAEYEYILAEEDYYTDGKQTFRMINGTDLSGYNIIENSSLNRKSINEINKLKEAGNNILHVKKGEKDAFSFTVKKPAQKETSKFNLSGRYTFDKSGWTW